MIHQLFIKLFIVLFIVNVTALWIIYDTPYLWYIGLLNLILLIMVLFQHRTALKEITTPWKRTLFTPSVFFLICIFVWLFAWIVIDPLFWNHLHISQLLWSVWLWLFTYVASYVLFQMDNEDSWWKVCSRFLFWILFLACLWRVGTMLWKVSWLWVFTNLFSREDAWKITVTQEVEQVKPWIRIEDIVNKEEVDTDEIQEEVEFLVPPQAITLMTYADLLPIIVNRYDLGPASWTYSFTNIANSSPLYAPFARARDLWMIWTDISPTRQVKCKNLMVIIGLAEWWNISTASWVFNAYWSEATSRWITQACGEQEDVAFIDYFTATP